MEKEKKITDNTKTCFVIMPISDPDGYDSGHFSRVYSHLIKPACKLAGVTPVRADDIKNTNYIVIDILKRIVKSDIVICDLSAKNPNVMYELGIRQAFNLPSVLIKDKRTERIFDIQGLRTVEYDDSLRVDVVESEILSLKISIEKTIEDNGKDVNSLIQLLGVAQAELKNETEISPETGIILRHIRDMSQRITGIEEKIIVDKNQFRKIKQLNKSVLDEYVLPNGESISRGDVLYSRMNNKVDILGYFIAINAKGALVSVDMEGSEAFLIEKDSPIYKNLTRIPF